MIKEQSPRIAVQGQEKSGKVNGLKKDYSILHSSVNLQCPLCGYFRKIPRPVRARAFCMLSGEPLRGESDMVGCPFWTPKGVTYADR